MFFWSCSLFLWLSIAFQALATPIRVQRPLLETQPKPSPLEVNHADIFVSLTFETGDPEYGVQLREVAFPMRKRIRPNEYPDLPRHPRIARIDNAYYSSTPGVPVQAYESIEAVVCYLYPSMDEQQGQFAPAYEFMAFRREDEVVDFQDPRGKLFLSGRAVDSFECV
ncbi:hypothetical protein MMC08_003811 [Hypocenomyce scalaris]|nr:hypothetical protein [Hypocenomyce scalaris]